jgi:hypothetical protein
MQMPPALAPLARCIVPTPSPPLLAGAYLAVTAGAFVLPCAPAVFWTVLMPIVPFAFVILGFSPWRAVCPLAATASFGSRVHDRLFRGRRRPRRTSRSGALAPGLMLFACLTARHFGLNGDGAALGTFLAAVALTAIVANAAGGGRTFCHRLCPVGVVERIYTDGVEAPDAAAAPCRPCSACVRTCGDAATRRRALPDRRTDLCDAAYAFPGLVFGFYAYFYARHGTWAAFFDGRWTTAGPEDLLAPGWFFAPTIPLLVAAPVTLLAASAVSAFVFRTLEETLARAGRGSTAPARAFAAASFVAFNTFYVFAGAPALAEIPGAPAAVAFAAPVVSTLVLAARWRRPGKT